MKRTLFLLLCSSVLILNAEAQKKLPNILVILSDDQGYADLGYSRYAQDYVKTPNIDALARSGMFFTDAHTSGMICAPTRAGLLTGRYQQRLGYWVGAHKAGVAAEEIMIPEYIEKNYVSGMFGKWHVGSAREEWYPGPQGFDTFYGFLGHGAHSYWALDIPEDPAEMVNAIRTNDGPINDKGYLTHRITEEAIKFMDSNKEQPFFAYVCYNAVHWPHEAPHQDVNLFRSNKLPIGRQLLMAMLKNLDDGVGEIMAFLKENGMEENTLIIFLSDNGGAPNMLADNTPLRNFKNSAYEGDWKWGYDRGNEFLYNLKDDISEENNLLTTYPGRTTEMKKRFGEWLSQMSEPDQGSIDWPLETIKKK